MEQAHKQRLVGGIVLLALGLIFIPMVLDFSSEDRSQIENAEIPDKPAHLKMEVLPLDVWSQKSDPQVSRDVRTFETPQGEVAKRDKAEEAAAKKDVAKSSEAAVKQPQQEKAVTKAAPKIEPKPQVAAPAEKTAAEPEPEKAATSAAVAWVVQVASLTVEKKAYTLRDSIRKGGHPAFVERVNGSSGAIYRVKAGPVVSRDKADAMKAEIKKLTKLDGLVMRHR